MDSSIIDSWDVSSWGDEEVLRYDYEVKSLEGELNSSYRISSVDIIKDGWLPVYPLAYRTFLFDCF